ncbi:MAG: hypothetical protein IJU72_02525, partial [Bacteroidales bacterium]|nr:hypothetical protein [Bacteroidales bacterium]
MRSRKHRRTFAVSYSVASITDNQYAITMIPTNHQLRGNGMLRSMFTTISRAALTALLALLTLSGWAQQGISYQAALRGPDGHPLANREVRLRLALADGGTTVYREDQTATTS